VADEDGDIAVGELPGTAVAGAAREVFLTVLCQDIREPSEPILERWMDCLEIVMALCGEGAMVKWADLSRRLVRQFYGYDSWENLSVGQQIAWEAAARTMVNWILVQDVADRQSLERFDWKSWARERLERELT